MDAFSNFEKVINAPGWKQRPTSARNYLCTEPDCYSNCGVQHSVGHVLLLFPMQLASCFECDHPHWSHSHLYSKWVQVQETKVSIDDNMKRQWEAAKDEKEKTEALVATSKRALDDLGHAMDRTNELARLLGEYADLSLAGCFSGPLEKTIRLLQLRCRAMEGKGASPEQLGRMQGSLEQMKGMLAEVKEARRYGRVF